MMMYLKMHIIKYSICIWHKICILGGIKVIWIK
jgi:hypothetical protein